MSVPAAELEAFLQSKGMERDVHRGEVVYRRKHHKEPRYVVVVYTTIGAGFGPSDSRRELRVRALGEDSIKVAAYQEMGDGRTRGVAKTTKILRTGSVEKIFARIVERLRSAYAVCNERVAAEGHVCHAIGCDVKVPPAMLMCRSHWFTVAKPIRDRVWRAYVPGQERSKTPSEESLEAIEDAVRDVAIKEGRITP